MSAPLRRGLERAGAHFVVLVAVVFALYPVLWVINLALSSASVLEPRVIPIPVDPTLDHFREVASTTRDTESGSLWLFGRQMANSLVVSLATAAVSVAIAIPTA